MSECAGVAEILDSVYGCPCVRTTSIGGSGTWALDRDPRRAGFPEELQAGGEGAVVARFRGLATPFGQVPLVKLLDVGGQPVLRIPVHGWHFPVPSLDDTLSVFWLLTQLGVEQIVVDASVGGVRAEPWDVVVPDDVITDAVVKQAVPRLAAELRRSPWVRMKDPFCSRLRQSLICSVQRFSQDPVSGGLHRLGRLIDGGTYYTTPLSVFETRAEIGLIHDAGATVVGQSTGQEAACARVCGMCLAVVNPVANFAEGLEGGAWIAEGMDSFYDELALPMASVLWWTLEEIVTQDRECDCQSIASSVDLDRYIWGQE